MLTLNLIPNAETMLRMTRRAYVLRRRGIGIKYAAKLKERAGQDPALAEKLKARGRTNARLWREANPEKAASLVGRRASAERHREEMLALKQKPCMDCGRLFPTIAMDFDHRNPEEKSPIARYAMRGITHMKAVDRELEIPKCDLVCACCHRIRTGKRQGWPSAEKWWT